MKYTSQFTGDTHQVDIHDIVQLRTMRLSAPYTWLEENQINREVKLHSGRRLILYDEKMLSLHGHPYPWLELLKDHWLEPRDDQWLEPHNERRALSCYAEDHKPLQQYDDLWLVAHYKVEVYRLEFTALMYNSKGHSIRHISCGSTVGNL